MSEAVATLTPRRIVDVLYIKEVFPVPRELT